MLNSEDIQTISSTVCRDMLGLDFEPSDTDLLSMVSAVASISITGDYGAVVEVAMSPKAANEVAIVMCGLNHDELQESDVADSIGEIVNIIGGNIKGAIPGDTKLSLPCVSLNGSGQMKAGCPQKSTTAFFRLSGEPFLVRMSSN